jgi:photosystem II stability/assembly factor-like uncharacterized protein
MQWIKKLTMMITLSLLAACGTVQISVEIPPTPPPATPSPLPSATAVAVPPDTPTQALPSVTQTVPATVTPTPGVTTSPGTLKPGQAVTILSIRMLDATSGWAVGQVETDLDDHLVFTQDGGQTWRDRTPQAALEGAPSGGLVATAYFANPSNAWAIYANRNFEQAQGDHRVWYTQDGGQTWQASEPLDLSGIVQEFFTPTDLGFLDTQHGWLMAHLGVGMSHDYIAVFTTDDGGQTWQRALDPQTNSELMGCYKTGLAFSTPSSGWLTGDCPGLMTSLFFYHTTDGGKTWQPVNLSAPAGEPGDLFAAQQAGCGILHLVYASARSLRFSLRCTFYQDNTSVAWLYASDDGGLTWAPRPLPTPYGNFDFTSPEEGWLVGSLHSDPSASSEVYASMDGGRSWDAIIPTGWQGVPNFVSPQHGWVVAHQGDRLALVVTTDGGSNWSEIKPVIGP